MATDDYVCTAVCTGEPSVKWLIAVVTLTVASLTDEDVVAIAAYLATLDP